MTLAELIDHTAQQLERADLCFGHGTDNARDEAAWLVLHVAAEPLDGSFSDWGRAAAPAQQKKVAQLLDKRCNSRVPLAYLLGTAWFAGLEFEVNENVLVPRSPLAELILDQYQPWVRPGKVSRVLDLCTGSGCIAIATAVHMPGARVDAADISTAALDIARRNIERHDLQSRVNLLQSDLFGAIPLVKYELIVSNPPYVPSGSISGLPAEYCAEPGLGLVSGEDGLDAVLTILLDAPGFLGEDGVLVCEVGESEQRLAEALPSLPFIWLEFAHGGSGVFVLNRKQLQEASDELTALIRKRSHVV
jgi:ribosomal protein L3 glutamine methyltransferase